MGNYTGKINLLIGASANDFYTAIGGVQKKLLTFSKDLDRISKDISLNVSLPLSILGGVATNTFATFEDSMLKVKALSSATEDEFGKLSDTAKQLGINTKFSASQVGDAMGFMALAGWNTQQILSGVEGVLSLAAASGEDLANVSDILTDGLSAFGKSADYAGRMADILAQTSAKSNTTVGLLGEAFKYVAPLAGSLRFSVEDVNLALGLMANSGIKGSQAGTALRATLSRLVKPTKESEEAMNALGFSAINTDGSIKPLAQIIEELRTKFKSLSPANQASNAAMLAGQEAMSGFLALMNASDSDFEKLQTNLINSDGAALKMAETMEGGLGGAIRRLKSSIEGILITIGDNLAPYISIASEWVNSFANSFNNLNPSVIKIITAIGVLLTVIPPLIVGLGGIIKIVTSSIASIKVLIPLLTGISAPVLAIAVGVGAAVFLIIKYWDEIKAYFTSGEGTVFLESLQSLFDKVFTEIKKIVSEFVTLGKELWSRYGNDITDVLKSVFGIVKGQIDNIIKIISLGLRFITTTIQVFLKLIQGDFKGAFGVIKDYLIDVFQTIASVVISAFKSVLGVAGTVAEKLGFDSISNGIDKAVKKLDSFNSKFAKTKKINQSVYSNPASSTLPTLVENTIEDPISGGGTIGSGSIRKTMDSISMVKAEFDKTTDLVKSKVDEITKKAFEAGIKTKEVAKNIQWSLGEYMDYFYQYNQSLFLFGEGVLVLGNALQNQLMNLFETGKFSFKGLIKEIGGFIAKLISAIAAAAILSALVGAIFGGGSAIGQALSFGNIAKQLSGGLLNFSGRAEGGSVDIGNAYLVGERGRELFVPNQSGTIISTNDLQSGMSQSILLDGKFRIEGSDLVYLVNKENQRRGRI